MPWQKYIYNYRFAYEQMKWLIQMWYSAAIVIVVSLFNVLAYFISIVENYIFMDVIELMPIYV